MTVPFTIAKGASIPATLVRCYSSYFFQQSRKTAVCVCDHISVTETTQ